MPYITPVTGRLLAKFSPQRETQDNFPPCSAGDIPGAVYRVQGNWVKGNWNVIHIRVEMDGLRE